MTTYAIAALTITDPSRIEPYGPPVHALVAKHDGRYLAQTPEVRVMEGDDADPNYKPWLESRNAGSHGPVLMFGGL